MIFLAEKYATKSSAANAMRQIILCGISGLIQAVEAEQIGFSPIQYKREAAAQLEVLRLLEQIIFNLEIAG